MRTCYKSESYNLITANPWVQSTAPFRRCTVRLLICLALFHVHILSAVRSTSGLKCGIPLFDVEQTRRATKFFFHSSKIYTTSCRVGHSCAKQSKVVTGWTKTSTRSSIECSILHTTHWQVTR